MRISSIFTAILYGILEGITEWLPISSTGHMILLEKWIPLPVEEKFRIVFDVVIQLFSVMAVISVYVKLLNPFYKGTKIMVSRDKMKLWNRILIASLPSAVLGLFLDDFIEKYLFNPTCVAVCLMIYGIVFTFVERIARSKIYDITASTALKIGFFQTLALVPGTSRSGATMIGGLVCGLPRETAAEFSFFIALPTMLGASGLKLIKYFLAGYGITFSEIVLLLIGGVSAYLVSLLVIRYLIDFLKKHSFRAFGVYRILVGAFILIYGYFERV